MLIYIPVNWTGMGGNFNTEIRDRPRPIGDVLRKVPVLFLVVFTILYVANVKLDGDRDRD